MRGPRFEVYERNDGQYDWRLKAGNAEIVATSHREGFRDTTDAVRSIHSVVVAIYGMSEDAGLPIVFLKPGELGMTPGGEETHDATAEGNDEEAVDVTEASGGGGADTEGQGAGDVAPQAVDDETLRSETGLGNE